MTDRELLLVIASQLCGVDIDNFTESEAKFVRYLKNHGLLKLVDKNGWYEYEMNTTE